MSRTLHGCRKDNDLKFTLPFVLDMLPMCQAVFTADVLEIKPPLSPAMSRPTSRSVAVIEDT